MQYFSMKLAEDWEKDGEYDVKINLWENKSWDH